MEFPFALHWFLMDRKFRNGCFWTDRGINQSDANAERKDVAFSLASFSREYLISGPRETTGRARGSIATPSLPWTMHVSDRRIVSKLRRSPAALRSTALIIDSKWLGIDINPVSREYTYLSIGETRTFQEKRSSKRGRRMGRTKMGDVEPSDSAALSVVKINLLIMVGQSEYFIYLVFWE